MKASETQQTADIGETAVELKFKRIGWNPVKNTSQELGTDYLVEARDFRRYNRGLIVGVQVKSGSSWFEEPGTIARSPLSKGGLAETLSEGFFKRLWSRLKKRSANEMRVNGSTGCLKEQSGKECETVSGWWYREDDTRHFDDWVTHGLPHILVLYDDDTDTAYWEHVTACAVENTGKGCKIFVREDQTLDTDHADELFQVACKQKAAPAIEGTAFLGAQGGLPPARQLRYALIAPRLVAPHPNAGFQSEIKAPGAVALLAQGRFRSLLQFAEDHPSVPDPREPTTSSRWDWGFVSAMWNWAMTGSTDELQASFDSALEQHQEKSRQMKEATAASGVLLACALRRMEQHQSALDVLNRIVEVADLGPVDYGWVLTQRARIRDDIGDLSGARDDAVTALRTLAGDEDDLTVSALASAATWQLFATADHAALDHVELQSSFADLLTASDTAVSWWRSQTLASGLNGSHNDWFKSWAEQTKPGTAGAGDAGTDHFLAAELSADVTGEHSNWKAMSSLAARHRLMRAANTDLELAETVNALDVLRRSGDHSSVKLAIDRIRRDGPLDAVIAAMDKIPVNGWTHTTADSNFEALAVGGDLLGEDRATEQLTRCAELVADPVEFNEQLRPSGFVPIFALRAATGLLPAVGRTAHNAVAELIAEQPNPLIRLPTSDLKSAVHLLEFDLVSEPNREALWELGSQEDEALGAAALGWLAANGHSGALSELKVRATGGDLHALAAMGDVSALNGTEAASLIDRLEELVEQKIAAARNSSYSFGGFDVGRSLALLNLWFPSEARWSSCLELLYEPAVVWHEKRPVCLLIAEPKWDMPQELRDTLVDRIEDIAKAAAGFGSSPQMGGACTALSVALGALEGEDADSAVVALASGSPVEREDLAFLLGSRHCPSQHPILAALVNDLSPLTRRKASIAVGRLASAHTSETIQRLARELANRDGTWLPLGLLTGLAYDKAPGSPVGPFGAEIAQKLQQHRSGQVRRVARGLLR